MFKILGEDALYIDIPEKFKKRMLELAGDDEKEKVFKDIVGRSEVTYLLNGTTEEHTFFIKVPKDVTPEQIQTMADASIEILKRTVETVPCVEVEGVRQKYQVIITNWEEPEIIGKNKTPECRQEPSSSRSSSPWTSPARPTPTTPISSSDAGSRNRRDASASPERRRPGDACGPSRRIPSRSRRDAMPTRRRPGRSRTPSRGRSRTARAMPWRLRRRTRMSR